MDKKNIKSDELKKVLKQNKSRNQKKKEENNKKSVSVKMGNNRKISVTVNGKLPKNMKIGKFGVIDQGGGSSSEKIKEISEMIKKRNEQDGDVDDNVIKVTMEGLGDEDKNSDIQIGTFDVILQEKTSK